MAAAVRRTGALLGAAALVASLPACTSSSTHGADVTSPATTASAPATQSPTTDTAPPSTSASAPTSSTPAPSTSASSAAPRSTCTTVTVRVIRGSASVGQEIAALQFTNEGTTSCTLFGFPTVTLLRNGNAVGNPSQPSTVGATSQRTLAPGDVAESVLHDYSSCNAPLSDSLRVQVPGSSTIAIRPAVLRGCILRVDKLGPPQ
jgi:Protein of unknown function (DUF4232)